MAAAVHFITIPRELNTVDNLQGKPHFFDICPSANDREL